MMSKTPCTIAVWSSIIGEPALNSSTTPYPEPGQSASSAVKVNRVPLCSTRVGAARGPSVSHPRAYPPPCRALGVCSSRMPSSETSRVPSAVCPPVVLTMSQRAMSAAELTMPPSPTV